MSLFGPELAGLYDLSHEAKDYCGESRVLQREFRRLTGRPLRSVLDLGCGTGGHAVSLARTGVQVTGVDVSGSMLAIARGRGARLTRPPRWICSNLRDLCLPERFDAVLMMFAVLGYQVGEGALAEALRIARSHLGYGGLLLADVWDGTTVLKQGPSTRTRLLTAPGGTVRRTARGRLDQARDCCVVDLSFEADEPDGSRRSFAERHEIRYFFREDMCTRLRDAGLELVEWKGFSDCCRALDAADWSVLLAARTADHVSPMASPSAERTAGQ